MKNEFQQLLRQKLKELDSQEDSMSRNPSAGPSTQSLLAPELRFNLKPLGVSTRKQSAYPNTARQQPSFGASSRQNPPPTQAEAWGSFYTNERVRLAQLFFASIGEAIPALVTRSQLKALYRKWAKRLHPDAGGEESSFRQLRDSYLELQKNWHETEAPVATEPGSQVLRKAA